MLLENKTAVVYGAGGATGSAVARELAREGARLFLTGRRRERLEALANEIGGGAEVALVDALDERAVEEHLAAVGSVDLSYNAIGIAQQGIQGVPLAELAVDAFTLPVTTYARAHFVTARAAARRMVRRGSGVILMHTPEPARVAAPLVGGMGPAWAAMESLCRNLSIECAPRGVRVVCLRTTGIPETGTIDVVFELHARAAGITRPQFQALVEGLTHRRRSTTLAELARVAAFVASDGAAAMTGTTINLTGGIVD